MPRPDLVGILPAEKKYASVVWQVSDVCNYRCSYCNHNNWGGENPNTQTQTYLSFLEQAIDRFQARGHEYFKFFFSGGEPSVWKPLIPLCEYIKKRTQHSQIIINTNFSRHLSWWKEHAHFFDDIVASFHVEFCNQQRYLENARYLQYRIPYLCYRLLMHDERFQEVVEFSEVLRRELDNYNIEYAPLMEYLSPQAAPHQYKQDWKREFLASHTLEEKRGVEINFLKSNVPTDSMEHYSDGFVQALNSNRVVSEDRNHFKNWRCWINDHVFINTIGQVRFGSCGARGVAGNINDSQIQLLDGPIDCPFERCNCGTDIYIPKTAPSFQENQKTEQLDALQ